MPETLKHKVLHGVFWQGFEKAGTLGLNFAISIILARLLMPEQFGVVAIVGIFTSLCSVFIDSGFGTALIQKKDADEVDNATVFYINIVMAFLFYWILFAISPLIANFYDKPELTLYLRVSALTMIIGSFAGIQENLLARRMLFHLSFRISWIRVIISGVVGVWMAYAGFGVWALITQQLVFSVIGTILYWLMVGWRPRKAFHWGRAKGLFSFGWKLCISAFLDNLYNNLYGIFIGKLFNLTTLSYYQRGRHYPELGMNVINGTVGGVMFPAFASIQDDREQMRRIAQKTLKTIMFFVIPILTCLALFAKPVVIIMLTEKWLPCVIFLQLSCATFFFWPFHTLNLQIINACGRSDYFLILEIIKKVQGVLVILITYRYGVVTMVAVSALMSFIVVIENGWANSWLIHYSPLRQLLDVVPMALCALLSCAVAGAVCHFCLPPDAYWLQIIIGGAMLIICYLSLCYFVKQIPVEFLFYKNN